MPRLVVRIEIGVKGWRGVERRSLHGLTDDLRNLRERAFTYAESVVDHFVGGIEDARHVSTFLNGLESELQALELLDIGLEELEWLVFEKIETWHVERQTFGERECILYRKAHVGKTELRFY